MKASMKRLDVKPHLDKIREGWWGHALVFAVEDRKDSFWLSPDGVWFNVASCQHVEFSSYLLSLLISDNEQIMERFDYNSNDALHGLGWVRCHGNTKYGLTVEGIELMTTDQYVALREHFGRRHLGNGRTIRDYWEAQMVNTGG